MTGKTANSTKVYLIGAGAGDPGLLTIAGRAALQQAEAVMAEATVNPALLREAKAGAEIAIFESTEAASAQANPNLRQVIGQIVELVRSDKRVALLLPGDPFSSDLGLAVADLLAAHRIAYEVVPGLPNFFASPLYAGIPLFYGPAGSSATLINLVSEPRWFNGGHARYAAAWKNMGAWPGTLVFHLLPDQLNKVVGRLIAAGISSDTAIALISGGTTWQQKVLVGKLGNIGGLVKAENFTTPLVVVVGETVRLRDKLCWWDLAEARPLLGKRIVVTRAREQAASLSARLSQLGANALEFPGIKIVEPESFEPMDAAIAHLENFDWVIFTSTNGIDYFMRRLKQSGRDARAFGRAKICTIGPATAQELEKYSLKADFMPSKYVGESILEELAQFGVVAGQKILLACADVAREVLYEGLVAQGALVERVFAYRQQIADDQIEPGEITANQLVALLEAGEVDMVTFASSNTIRNFAARLAMVSNQPLDALLAKTRIACIGPITAGTARELGLAVEIEADEFTLEKLVALIAQAFRQQALSV